MGPGPRMISLFGEDINTEHRAPTELCTKGSRDTDEGKDKDLSFKLSNSVGVELTRKRI